MKNQMKYSKLWLGFCLGSFVTVGIVPGTVHAQFGGGLGGGGGGGGLEGPPSVPAGGTPGMGAPGGMGGGMGGMGGMGGGMMGGGGMGGYGTGSMLMPNPNAPLVIWQKPQGEAPQWLETGNNSLQANEDIRRSLEKPNNCDFAEVPLKEAILQLLERAKIDCSFSTTEIESTGQSVETPVTLSGTGTTRELLRRILSPLDLGYIVHENSIEITSLEVAESEPVLLTYDLAHVMPNNQGLTELLLCIQTTIDPDVWGGGNASLSPLGSLLVVRAPENVHHEIAKLLVIRSRANGEVPNVNAVPGATGVTSAGGPSGGNSDPFGSAPTPLGGEVTTGGLPPPSNDPFGAAPSLGSGGLETKSQPGVSNSGALPGSGQ